MLVALALSLFTQESIGLTVEAGKHDRTNTPVRVGNLVLSDRLQDLKAVVLAGSDGSSVVAQLSEPSATSPRMKLPAGKIHRELTFILPSLKAGSSVTYKDAGREAPADVGFHWKEELCRRGKPVLKYVSPKLDESSKEAREQTYKIFHHLYDPAGERLVTKGAGGKFTHHRGIFYGFNKVTYGSGKSCDIWHCTGGAFQEHEAVVSTVQGPVQGRHTVRVAWHGAGKEVFAREERELTVWQSTGGTLVEFHSTLVPVLAPIKLDGDPQHAGFHFRADNEVADKTAKETWYLRPDGAGKPGETRNWPAQKDHVNLPWNAMSFVLGGKRYTAAYLDHPGNPKEARFSERDYGRFGSYFVHTIEEGKNLAVNYRLWLQEGEMKGEHVAAKAADFVDPPKVTLQ